MPVTMPPAEPREADRLGVNGWHSCHTAIADEVGAGSQKDACTQTKEGREEECLFQYPARG